MRNIIKLITLIIGLFMTESLYAQTFKVTDMEFASSVSEYRKNKDMEAIGHTIVLTEYDRTIVAEVDDGEKIVFQKLNDNTYVAKKNNDVLTLTIEKLMGYYRAAKLRNDKNGEWYRTMILKRK